LVLRAKVVRSAGISPLLMFFDATTTTDSAALGGANNTFQDVSYTWDFGDTGASGSGTWAYGANAGHNSKNTATGAVAAHLYITNGSDTTYPVTVRAYDGVNTASCSLGVTAYDPSGANGFPGSATTCVAASSLPVAGSGGCPAGAAVLQQSNIGSAFSAKLASGKRILFKCGDTFTGSGSIGSSTTQVVKASIGAYGGCENTTTKRPILSSGNITINEGTVVNGVWVPETDVRITDLDFESSGYTASAITYAGANSNANPAHLGSKQITMYNLNATQYGAGFYMDNGTESGLIQSTCSGKNLADYCSFWNFSGNTCLDGTPAAGCGGGGYVNNAYNALMGNNLDGAPNPGSGGGETVRVGDCRLCIFSNNRIANSSPNWGATLKFASGNWGSSVWLGQYSEYFEIADNLFTGTSGTVMVSMAPMNAQNDERERYGIFERNYIQGTVGAAGTGNGATKVAVAAVNVTVRNNVWFVPAGDTYISDYNLQVSKYGIEPTASGVEVYNNTCYALTQQSSCAAFAGGDSMAAPGINSFAQNNLFYNNGTNATAVRNDGTGNTVSNNTTNSAANPLMINANGSFNVISDFQPTQNYSGGGEAPVWYDAVGEVWSPAWSLGALKP